MVGVVVGVVVGVLVGVLGVTEGVVFCGSVLQPAKQLSTKTAAKRSTSSFFMVESLLSV